MPQSTQIREICAKKQVQKPRNLGEILTSWSNSVHPYEEHPYDCISCCQCHGLDIYHEMELAHAEQLLMGVGEDNRPMTKKGAKTMGMEDSIVAPVAQVPGDPNLELSVLAFIADEFLE